MSDRHSDIAPLLDDFVDGDLSPADAGRVEEHLGVCAACREEVEGLRDLVADSRDLPRELPPTRDLWPGIEARLEDTSSPRVVRLPRRPRLGWPVWTGLAAAAALVLALLALPGRNGKPGPDSAAVESTGAPAGTTATVPAAMPAMATAQPEWPALHRALEAEVQSTGRLVMAAWQSREAGMDPALNEQIDTGLTTLDVSINETVEALEKDPDNPGLMDMLSDLYGKKLRLLKKTLRLAGVA